MGNAGKSLLGTGGRGLKLKSLCSDWGKRGRRVGEDALGYVAGGCLAEDDQSLRLVKILSRLRTEGLLSRVGEDDLERR